MNSASAPAYLIVNADDYGYFRCVSRGILEAATRGIVTATGVFANSQRFDDDVPALRECEQLDAGVHLNLTDGRPLTTDMRARLARWGGRFPGKFAIAAAVATGRVPVATVELEWRAQIERCLAAGLTLRFLNSHEHIHMHPRLFGLVQHLADEFGIAHVRYTTATPRQASGGGALARSAIVNGLAAAVRRQLDRPVARFLGLECSGRIGPTDLDAMTASLQPGAVYELMCHPGHLDRAEIADPRLLGYHDWERERAALTEPSLPAMLAARAVRLVRYRDVDVAEGRLVLRRDRATATESAGADGGTRLA
jgi:predicted glycoside hydrolase/deacetylase ChbG (UPF0249 family)